MPSINLGGVGNPVIPGLQATDMLLDADAHSYRIRMGRVDYEHEAVVKAIEQACHPTPACST